MERNNLLSLAKQWSLAHAGGRRWPNRALTTLVDDGLVKVADVDARQPIYSLTEDGWRALGPWMHMIPFPYRRILDARTRVTPAGRGQQRILTLECGHEKRVQASKPIRRDRHMACVSCWGEKNQLRQLKG